MHSPILAPMIALVIWSLIMLFWMVVIRLPAMNSVGLKINELRGSKPGGLDGVVPDSAQWKAHNYIHLMEQPTLFYAVVLTLAILGAGDGLNCQLAWAYTGLRVVHSLIQATSNIIKYRFLVFALSTAVLLALTVHAAFLVF